MSATVADGTVVDAVLTVVAAGCLLGGAALSLAASIGLLRLPDVLSRMHAATKPQVLGLLLVILGAGIELRETVDVWMLVLAAAFQLITAPVAAHMVGRASYRSRHLRRDLLVIDEVALAQSEDHPRGDDHPRGQDRVRGRAED